MSYVLFDIGGTNTRVSVSEDLKVFCEPIKFKTSKDFKEGIDQIAESAKKLTDKDIRGMAGGVRGVLNDDKTEIAHDPGGKLSDWVEQPIVKSLKKKLSTQVFLHNDTSLVGLGEAVSGAGEGYDIVAYHTVSTGVGGAKIVDGEIDHSAHGFEPGHQILDIDRTILGEEIEPTLENLVSGSALETRTGQKPFDIPQNDAVWDQLAKYLAYGIRNTVLYWSPDVIVLGGSMIVGDPRIFLDDIKKHTIEVLGDEFECPDIVDATLGDFGGLYGAMALLNAER